MEQVSPELTGTHGLVKSTPHPHHSTLHFYMRISPTLAVKNPGQLVTPSLAEFVLAIMTAGTECWAYSELCRKLHKSALSLRESSAYLDKDPSTQGIIA